MSGMDNKAYRKKCLYDAIASFALEGVTTEQRILDKGQEYVDGSLSIQEMIDWYHHIYEKQMTEGGNAASYMNGLMMNLSKMMMNNLSVLCLVQIQDSGKAYSFNLSGLYQLHRDIFRYCTDDSIVFYEPNKIREKTPDGKIWIKERHLWGGYVSTVVYSDMSEERQAFVETYLEKTIQLNKLKPLSKRTLAEVLSQIYSALDYLHPFYDGNSRTIREWMRELCKELGYDFRWRNCLKKANGREELFLARDYEVNQLALKNTEMPELHYDISQYLEQQKDHRPLRAIIYENLYPIEENV